MSDFPSRPSSALQPTASTSRLGSAGLAPALGLVPSSSTSRVTMNIPPSAQLDSRLPPVPSSPSKKKAYGDRFIPLRVDGVDIASSFKMIPNAPSTPSSPVKRSHHEPDGQTIEESQRYTQAMRAELFPLESGMPGTPSSLRSPSRSRATSATGAATANANSTAPSSPASGRALFSYGSPSRKKMLIGERERVIRGGSVDGMNGGAQGLDSPTHSRYSVSPVRLETQQMLLSPRKAPRVMSKVPHKVLDAPELADDYYLNLIDWSSQNILAVGLGSSVYTWSAHTSEVKKLCDLAEDTPADSVTSLSWIQRGAQLAVGTKSGSVQIWDAAEGRIIRTMSGHSARVGALAWNDAILSSGSHDRLIYHRDVRVPQHHIARLAAHREEVCGLKWNTQENQLASGGNDNKLFVFDKMSETPMYKFTEHCAAIKAIAWSPHQHGILASGGGTADMKLRFWNTLTGSLLNEIDTGSQICNLMWSKNSNELVSTHGFSAGLAQNQVCIWKYPTMTQVATLTGHTYRVLYLAMSPDGQTIVTGAGDETIRFWSAFPKSRAEKRGDSSALNPFSSIR